MTQLDELYARLDAQEAIIARCRPELDALKIEIGPWLRATAGGTPMAEPVEARERYAALQADIWQARNYHETQRELGAAENHARRLIAQIAELDAEIERLSALPTPTSARAARVAEEMTRLGRYRESHQRTLDTIGLPRSAVLKSDAMKAGLV